MGEAFLRQRLEQLGVDAHVHSAGLLEGGRRASAEGVELLAGWGLDTATHRSRRIALEMVTGADLVVCMAREHLREVVLLHQDAWPRSFTLKELVRRAEQVGPRSPDQPFDEWLAKIHAGRSRAELLGSAAEDDVVDPIGLGREAHRRSAVEIHALVERFAELGWEGR